MKQFKTFLTQTALLIEDRIDFHAQKLGVPREHIEKLAEADPNPKKKNLNWLVKQVRDGHIPELSYGFGLDQVSKHKQVLSRFEELKKKYPEISSEKHIGDLNKHTADTLDSAMDKFESKYATQAFLERWGEKVFDKDDNHIYHAATPEQATNHGKNSEWCTRILNGKYQEHYLKNGDLFIHYPKDSPKPGEEGHAKGDHDNENRHQFWIPHNNYGDHVPELKDFNNRSEYSRHHENNHPALVSSKHWRYFRKAEYEHQSEPPEPSVEDLVNGNEDDRVRAIQEHQAHHGYDHLYSDPSPNVRTAIIHSNFSEDNEELDDHTYQMFRDDPHHAVRSALARQIHRPKYAEEMYNAIPIQNLGISERGYAYIATDLALNHVTPHSVLSRMVDNDKNFSEGHHEVINASILKNKNSRVTSDNDPKPNPSLHRRIFERSPNLTRTEYVNMSYPWKPDRSHDEYSLLKAMSKSDNPNARAAVAQNHGSHHEFAHLAHDPLPDVHTAMIRHDVTKKRFLDDPDGKVRRAAWQFNYNTGAKETNLLDKFAQSSDPDNQHIATMYGTSKHLAAVGNNPGIGPSIINNIVSRLGMENKFRNDTDLHRELANTPHLSIAREIASYTNDRDVLHQLAKRDSPPGRAILSNRHSSIETIRHLVDHPVFGSLAKYVLKHRD